MNRPNKRVLKCVNSSGHTITGGEGRILAILGADSIYLHCKGNRCLRWTEVKFSFPGVRIDLREAAITQRVMPKGYHFDFELAAVVVQE